MVNGKRKFEVKEYKAPQYEILGKGLTEELGKMFKEALIKDTQNASIYKEHLFKEDVTTATATGAYTTMLANIMQTTFVNDERLKAALALLYVNDDMVNATGYGAYQVPILDQTIAVEVAEGAVINYFPEGATPKIFTPRKVVAGTKITWEIRKRGMNGLTQYILSNAKDAIIKKMIGDIVNGIGAGAGYTTTTGMTYANVVQARAYVNNATSANGQKYGFEADSFVVSTTDMATILLDTDFRNSMYPLNANPNSTIPLVGQIPLQVLGMKVYETPFLTVAKGIVFDSKRCAMLFKESDLEFYEGRLPGSVDTEVIALQSYVVGVLFVYAACAMS